MAARGGVAMTDLFLLSEAQMRRIEPFFPLSHGVPRVDDRRVISGIVFVIRNGLRWRDAPREYGPHKTVYNRLSLIHISEPTRLLSISYAVFCLKKKKKIHKLVKNTHYTTKHKKTQKKSYIT